VSVSTWLSIASSSGPAFTTSGRASNKARYQPCFRICFNCIDSRFHFCRQTGIEQKHHLIPKQPENARYQRDKKLPYSRHNSAAIAILLQQVMTKKKVAYRLALRVAHFQIVSVLKRIRAGKCLFQTKKSQTTECLAKPS
jgi:hypothetical protein